ncbi:MAG: TetR/AcrR family transcriptional regulator [Gemmatimonadota bacterium]|jgi:AcrR family transcriptional regulator
MVDAHGQTGRETRAERSARIREELVVAAARVFRRDGFHGASLDRVSAEAGYTKGAVYSNFDGKDDLFFAVYDRQVTHRFDQLTEAFDAGGMREAIHRYMRLVDEDRAWSILLVEFTAYASRHPHLRAALAQRSRALTARVADHVGSSVSEDPDVVERISLAALTVSTGVTVRRVVDPGGVPEDLAEALVLRFMEGEGLDA